MSIAESYRLASWPALIRPRWPGHARYWEALTHAANGGDVMRWAYATGLCLLGQCERHPGQSGHSPRRVLRPTHRHEPPDGTDVPC